MTESNRHGERAVDDELDDLIEEESASAAASGSSGSRSALARSKPPAKPRTREGGGVNLFGRLIRFLREVVAELQKVIWPTRKELITYTTVVVVFVTAIATVVTLLDLGFARVVLWVFGSK